jgi:hypothetical protein
MSSKPKNIFTKVPIGPRILPKAFKIIPINLKGKSRSFLKENYFPSNKTFKYKKITYENDWVLCGELKVPNKKSIKNFLPKLIWIKEKNYLVIKNNYSIYNGNYLYWYKRLCNLEFEQKFLLKKKFLFENKVEIYNLFATLKY